MGYIEFGYARFAGVATAALENAAGAFVVADLDSGRAALANVELPDDMQLWIPDPPGENAYPIVTFSWLVLSKHLGNADKSRALRGLIEYCLTSGQQIADRLGYIPLPEQVVSRIRSAAEEIR
jgi:phosphate transport system substrate-binding protein